jgi:hypothetical protein
MMGDMQEMSVSDASRPGAMEAGEAGSRSAPSRFVTGRGARGARVDAKTIHVAQTGPVVEVVQREAGPRDDQPAPIATAEGVRAPERVALARKVSSWPKRCKLARAFQWEYS